MQRRLRRAYEAGDARFTVVAYMVVLPSQHSRCPRKIVTGRSTMMRLVLAILAMLTEVVALTGVSVSLYAVSGSSTRAAVDKTEIRSIPKTTIVPRRYFTERTPSYLRRYAGSITLST